LNEITRWGQAAFRDFREKTTGSHVALGARNLGTEIGRVLFECSKDAASLLLKNFLVGGAGFLWVTWWVEDF